MTNSDLSLYLPQCVYHNKTWQFIYVFCGFPIISLSQIKHSDWYDVLAHRAIERPSNVEKSSSLIVEVFCRIMSPASIAV